MVAAVVDPSSMTGTAYDAAGGITRFHPNHFLLHFSNPVIHIQ